LKKKKNKGKDLPNSRGRGHGRGKKRDPAKAVVIQFNATEESVRSNWGKGLMGPIKKQLSNEG